MTADKKAASVSVIGIAGEQLHYVSNKIIAKAVACYNQQAAFSVKSLERMV